MTSVTIHHLHTRLSHGAQQGDAALRLKRLLAEMVERALEPALRRCAVDASGELCVRRVVVPALRLDLAAPDGVLIERWAQAWAEAIQGRLARRDAEVLHYGSRAHALADLLLAASAGDFSRAWAWRRLGLWTADDGVTGSNSAGLVMRALVGEPRAAVAALAQLAQVPARFERWLSQSSATALQALADAVQRAAGGVPASLPPGMAVSPAPPAMLARLLRRSAIGRALASTAASQAPAPGSAMAPDPARADRPDARKRAALAVLVVAEAEPALLRAPATRLGPLLAALGRGGDDASPSAPEAVDAPLAGAPKAPAAGQPSVGAAPPSRGHDADPLRPAARADHAASRPGAEPVHDAAAQPLRAETADAAVATALPDLRRRARTAHAGVLFLLNLAADLGWPEALLRHTVLEARGVRWCLHRLALTLLPLDARDPAALAFAGLLPDAEPPDGDPPPDAAETAALGALGADVLRALQARLREPGASDAEALARVCRRQAEIVADPGWLEVHMALDDVSTVVRLAGLDLDPGWLPWLGLIVRFVYE